MDMQNTLPPILTVEEVAKVLRIGRVKAYQMAQLTSFPSVKIGRSVRVPTKALFEWIDKQKAV